MSFLHEQTQLLYEIAIDIGGNIDIEVMLNKSMTTMLRKLNCLGGMVFADIRDGDRYRPKEIFALPHNINKNPAYSAAVGQLSMSAKPGTGRTCWSDPKACPTGDLYYYFFDLNGFGVLVLLRAHLLDSPLARSLRPICDKLAESCIACETVAALADSRESLRTTLDSIGDGVIATDTSGRITRMNPAAEKLSGWCFEDVAGKPLTQVFNIIHAKSRQPVENPAEKALATGKIVEIANHTALIARDGTEYQIAESAAPIQDDRGRVIGVVLVFRDVTEEYKIREALRETEVLHHSIQDNSPTFIFIKDTEGRYLFVNRMYEKVTRLSNEDIKGTTDYDRFPRDQADAVRDNDLKIIETGKTLEFEETVLYKGKQLTYMSVKFPLMNADGEIFAICGISTDITERKRAEETLRESENRLREAQQLAHLGYWFWDVKSGAVKWSDEVYKIFRLDPKEFIPQIDSILELSPWPEDHQRDKELIQRAVESRKQGSYEQRFLRPNGSTGYYMSTFQGIYDEDGDLTAIKGTVQDITKRKIAEENLSRLRNYLSNIIDSMPSVLIGVDSEGRVTQWNRQAQCVTGVSESDALSQPLAQAIPRLAAEMERIRRAIQIRQEQTYPRRLYHQRGETRYEDVTIYPLIANGTEGAVIRIDDVTERLRIEEMMIQSEKMVFLGGLAAGMAHEINNPLAGIMQTAAVMTERLTGELRASYRAAEASGTSMEAIRSFMEKRGIPRMLNTIRESGQRAATIVNNMLGLARKGDATVSSCNLAELLDQTVELARTDYDLKKQYDFKKIEIVREYADHLPTVPCESQKIQQVLLNILRNGAQAMQQSRENERNKQRFVLRAVYEQQAKVVRIEIADNGPGMDEVTRKRVFEPFFTTKPVGIGTGLGLSVSYFIIAENHGGNLSVESQPGAGTTFIIRLPVDRRVQ